MFLVVSGSSRGVLGGRVQGEALILMGFNFNLAIVLRGGSLGPDLGRIYYYSTINSTSASTSTCTTVSYGKKNPCENNPWVVPGGCAFRVVPGLCAGGCAQGCALGLCASWCASGLCVSMKKGCARGCARVVRCLGGHNGLFGPFPRGCAQGLCAGLFAQPVLAQPRGLCGLFLDIFVVP